jgi:hypothetical protein
MDNIAREIIQDLIEHDLQIMELDRQISSVPRSLGLCNLLRLNIAWSFVYENVNRSFRHYTDSIRTKDIPGSVPDPRILLIVHSSHQSRRELLGITPEYGSS